MKKLFWFLWALVIIPVGGFYLIPFVGFMSSKSVPLQEIFLFASIIPFCIAALYTLGLELTWRKLGHREVAVWRLPFVSGLGVAAMFWLKVIVMFLNWKWHTNGLEMAGM